MLSDVCQHRWAKAAMPATSTGQESGVGAKATSGLSGSSRAESVIIQMRLAGGVMPRRISSPEK